MEIRGIRMQEIDPAQEIANEILDRPALLFAGQGAQKAGMGRNLAESSKDAMDLWKKAERESGLPLREIYWEGDEKDMNNTAAVQPALTVVNLNLWQEAERRWGIQPLACAGHSLGEISALAASHIISPDDALRITSLRGRLMNEAALECKGEMAAILKLEEKDVLEIVDAASRETGELVVAANFNTPSQIVISGTKKAVASACQRAKERHARCLELKLAGAFHSPMMAEANKELMPLLEKVTWNDPRFPVYTNAEARPVHTGQDAKKSLMKQMISPVFWVNLLRSLYLAGVRWWIEISPRAVLGKMVGPSLAGIAGHCETLRVDVINSLNSILQATI